MEHGSWLTFALVYLGAAVLAVPLARLAGSTRRGKLGGPAGKEFAMMPAR